MHDGNTTKGNEAKMSERAQAARKWIQPKCPSTDRQRKKMWYVHTMQYAFVLETKRIL